MNRLSSLLLLALVLTPLHGFPQQQQRQLPPPIGQTPPGENPPDEDSPIRKEMEKKANKQRQDELKRDTERLFKLSTELKEYVDKTNENVMSLNVIKKADEIEKLAHSVKAKMRGY